MGPSLAGKLPIYIYIYIYIYMYIYKFPCVSATQFRLHSNIEESRLIL
jgi:hypothetical protein